MRLVGALLTATCLWVPPHSHAASDIATEVRARLADTAVVRGEFEQRKTVTGFSKQLISSGRFLLWRERGVLWQTRKPLDSELVLTRDRLASRAGSASYQLDAGKEPSLRVINQLLFAVLAGDVASLQQRFRITGELIGTNAWRIELVPADAELERFLRRVELHGDRYVRRVQIEEANGDRTSLRFEALSDSPPPTPEEVRLLAQ